MKKIFFIIIVACLVATPSWALILNGSFEDGVNPPNGGYRTLNAGSTDLTGWTIGSLSIDWIGNYWIPSEGSRSIDLAGDTFGWISQTFATIAGTSYRLSFDMAGNPDGGEPIKDLFVTVGSTSQAYSFDTTGKTKAAMGWEPRIFDFTATGDQTTLTFLSLEGSSPFGPVLDNIVIAAVPIPSAAWLLGSGLIGLVVVRRRFFH